MLTKKDLAELLEGLNVEALSTASGVSTKTIYRLRNLRNSPNLDTVEALVRAAEAMRRKPVARIRS